jgi:carbonic anhydrase
MSNITARASLGLAALSVCLGGCAGMRHDESAAHAPAPAAGHPQDGAKVTGAEANQRLVAGNQRFVSGKSEHPRQTADRRSELATTQHPFAVVLGCADSRTGPEVLFDQGLGDLFVVREAGNVLDDHTLGSIEYAAEHLHAPLIVVLGHERCGAVAAARDTLGAHGHAEGHIQSLVEALRPAVEATSGQDAEATCRANIQEVVHALRTSAPLLQHMVETKELAVVGAYYDLDTGKVTFLPDH